MLPAHSACQSGAPDGASGDASGPAKAPGVSYPLGSQPSSLLLTCQSVPIQICLYVLTNILFASNKEQSKFGLTLARRRDKGPPPRRLNCTASRNSLVIEFRA